MTAAARRVVAPTAVEVVVQAARAALAAERGSAGDASTPGAADDASRIGPVGWQRANAVEIVRAARIHRVVGLLVERSAAIGVPPEVHDALRAVARQEAVAGLRLAAQTVQVAAVLAAAGVANLAVKGSALSVQSTGSVTGRVSVDVDVLIRPDDLAAAHDALTAAGWSGGRLPEPGRHRRWYQAMRRERTYLPARAGGDQRRPDAAAIDLHWRLGWHARPLPGTDTLLGRSAQVTIAGARVDTLSLPDALAAACYHLAVDRYARLRQFVDVARLVAQPGAAAPVDASWRLRRVMGESIALTDALLGPLPRAAAFVPAGAVDLDRLVGRWRSASVRQEWTVDDLSLAQMVGVYADSARFAGVPAAGLMALTDGLLPPERIEADGAGGVVATVAGEIGDLVRRRVLGRTQ